MSQKDSAPPAPEVKDEQPVVETETKVEEETLADALDTKEEHKVPDSIPYDRFKEKVDENKELRERVEALEAKAQDQDMSKKEIAADLGDIADEFNIDSDVLDKIAGAVEARAKAQIEEQLAPLTQRQAQEKRDAAFEKMFAGAIENNPEYKDVVNKDVIKQLAFNPANADKTFSQILEMSYGNLVKGTDRKTMETTQPGKSDETIDKVDYNRAQTDSEYFNRVKADPTLKEQYNTQMRDQLSRLM